MLGTLQEYPYLQKGGILVGPILNGTKKKNLADKLILLKKMKDIF